MKFDGDPSGEKVNSFVLITFPAGGSLNKMVAVPGKKSIHHPAECRARNVVYCLISVAGGLMRGLGFQWYDYVPVNQPSTCELFFVLNIT